MQLAERSVRGRSTHDDDCCVEIPRGGNFDQVTGSRNTVAFALVQLWHTHTHSCGKQRHVWQIHTNTLLWQTHKSTQNKHLLVEVRFEESPLEKILSINYEIYSEFSTSSYLIYTQQNHMSKVPRHIRIFWFASCQSQSGPWTHDDFAFCAPRSDTLSSFTEARK